MADDDFPDTYTTKTTTTTETRTTTTVCTFNKAYVKSLPGILRIAQIAVGLVYWIILATNGFVGRGFLITFTVIACLCTIALFVIFLFYVNGRITFINWPLTEFINNVIWAVLHVIGVILIFVTIAKYDTGFGHWLGLILAIALTALYGFHAFLGIRAGTIVFRSSGGGDVQT